MKKKMRKWPIGAGILLFIGIITVIVLYKVQIIPHKQYSSEAFGITPYMSLTDKNQDGVDDQTEIIQGVREYIATKPRYKSKYYGTGYPDDEYGVCTDVVANGLLSAGYDLQELVNVDIVNHPERYDIEKVDKNIDFRRVRNLYVYFKHNAISLTTDTKEYQEWQGGDIVVFKQHIGIVSDKRNRNGVPFMIHHAGPQQIRYEEDTLENHKDIIGHFRIS